MDVKTASEKAVESRKLAAQLLYYKYPTTQAVSDIARNWVLPRQRQRSKGMIAFSADSVTRTCKKLWASAPEFPGSRLGRSVDEPKIEFIANNCIGCGSCAMSAYGFVKMETTDDADDLEQSVQDGSL